MKNDNQSKISRSPVKPIERDHKIANVANMLLGSIGNDMTLISQAMLLNITNYQWLTDIPNTNKNSVDNISVLHKTVKDINEYCRRRSVGLGLLIIPHTSASEYESDEVCAIPWQVVRADPKLMSGVTSLFDRVIQDSTHGESYVKDAKTFKEGSDVL